jgi:hypothetical protein
MMPDIQSNASDGILLDFACSEYSASSLLLLGTRLAGGNVELVGRTLLVFPNCHLITKV